MEVFTVIGMAVVLILLLIVVVFVGILFWLALIDLREYREAKAREQKAPWR